MYPKDLTEEQKAQLPAWIEKWRANMLNTTPLTALEKESVTQAIRKMYLDVNYKEPQHVLFCSSPFAGTIITGLAAAVLFLRDNQHRHEEEFGAVLTEEDYFFIICLLSTFIPSIIRTTLAADVNTDPHYVMHKNMLQVNQEILQATFTLIDMHPPQEQVDEMLKNVLAKTPDTFNLNQFLDLTTVFNRKFNKNVYRFFVKSIHNSSFIRNGGSQWSGWNAYVTFCRYVIKWELDYSKWHNYEVSAIAGPRFIHEKFAVVTDRPKVVSVISVDDQNRLHNETGPAQEWRDGYKLYYWHGTSVPSEWIETPESLTPEIALSQRNIEKRRAACEMLKWKIFDHLPYTYIDRNPDPKFGDLIEVDLPETGKSRFLRAQCPTGRTFVLPVPMDVTTAVEAGAWSYNLPPEEYLQLQTRT